MCKYLLRFNTLYQAWLAAGNSDIITPVSPPPNIFTCRGW